MARGLTTLLLMLLLAGCGSPRAGSASSAARHFEDAVAAEHWPTACDLLAPSTREELERSEGTPCDAALPHSSIRDPGLLRSVHPFGTMAVARFAEDTVFLTRPDHRWLVLAAGCAPGSGAAYECRVSGG
jgi:hypothetical protein